MGIKWKWENLNKTRQNQPNPPPPNFPKARSKGVQKATSNIKKKKTNPPKTQPPKPKQRNSGKALSWRETMHPKCLIRFFQYYNLCGCDSKCYWTQDDFSTTESTGNVMPLAVAIQWHPKSLCWGHNKLTGLSVQAPISKQQPRLQFRV